MASPLLFRGGFDRLNVAESVTQQAATEAHRVQILSPGDCVDATTPAFCELFASEKANKDLLTDSGKRRLWLARNGGSG